MKQEEYIRYFVYVLAILITIWLAFKLVDLVRFYWKYRQYNKKVKELEAEFKEVIEKKTS